MVKKKNMKINIVVLLIMALVLTSFTSFAVEPAVSSNIETVSLKDDMAKVAESKIDLEVHKVLSEDDFVEVLVELTEKVDTARVSKQAVNRTFFTAKPTAYQEKMASRYAVVDALKNTAETSQKNILKYLSSEKEDGNVEEFRSFYIVNMVYVKATKEVVENLSYYSEVKAINLDQKIEVEWPEISEADINNNDDNIEWGVEKIGAPAVWDEFGIDGTGVVVGILDSGVDMNHEALMEKWRGYNPLDPANPNPEGNWFDAVEGRSLPYDETGIPHGTHVTGTILGQGSNGENIIGVAPGATFISAKAFTDAEGGKSSWLLAAGEWMLAPNGDPSLAPDVINNSWGGGAGLNEWYRPMVQAWRDAGILPVFSAGNDSEGHTPGTVSAPSNYPESYSIAATDINNKRGSFSNEGPGPYDEIKPDISAPGVSIRSSVPGGEYQAWSGTSMAAPHITGTVALLLSADVSLTPDQLEELMAITSIPLTDEDYPESPNYGYGIGLVNAYNAVSAISSGLGVIEGQVLKEGNDNENPELIHEPLTEVYEGMDLPVLAMVNDNVSVSKVELHLKQEASEDWVIFDMDRIEGNFTEGKYLGTIPFSYIQGSGFEYKIKAVDFGENIVETPIYQVEIMPVIRPDEYETDFSEYPSGWIFDGDWEWGEPTVGPELSEGNNLIGTNLDGNYSDNNQHVLVMPPVNLSDLTEATLRFDSWYETENNYDMIAVAVSTDLGETWDFLAEYTGEDRQWRKEVIDLVDYVGLESNIIIAFGLLADSSMNRAGWYIDNVKLVGTDTEGPEAPSGLEASASPVGVNLSWTASSDGDLVGYYVYRSITSGVGYEKIGDTVTTSFLDNSVEDGQEYFYTVKAYDLYENEGEPSNEASITTPILTIAYFNNFEDSDGGFTIGGENSSWEWGTPVFEAPDVPGELPYGPLEAFSGTNIWGTDIDGSYENNSNSWIESPEIDLSGLATAELNFYDWYSTEKNYDECHIKISTDNGQTWTDLVEKYSDTQREWTLKTISLNEYVGQNIKLRFLHTSDSSGNFSGWYIDDVRVTGSAENTGNITRSVEKTVKKIAEEIPAKDTQPVERVIDFNLQKYLLNNNYSLLNNNEAETTTGLPLDAVVTVIETGKTVRTNLADGTFRMLHMTSPEGENWTLRVESYGYYPVEEEIQLTMDEEVFRSFTLQPIPTSSVSGKVVDERTGEPIVGATVKVVEDPRISSGVTDDEGNFILENVLEGQWTLRVSAADYQINEVSIEVDGSIDTEVDVELKPFINYVDEIAYDDGTWENARLLSAPDNGFGVRMTPKEFGLLNGANVYFYDATWPDPGGNEIKIAAFDSKPDGKPGEMLFMTDIIEIVRGEWNFIDLSEYNFTTDRDFYLVTMQAWRPDLCPGVGFDESSPNSLRNYRYVLAYDEWTRIDEEWGNIMLRASMEYELDIPVISNPVDGTQINEDIITVSGTVESQSLITAYVNGEEAASTESANKEFAIVVPLVEGENIITVTADAGDSETDPSDSITVIKDTVLPGLEITAPIDGFATNKRVVEVTGIATDEYLAGIIVNDLPVEFNEDGSFTTETIVYEGENTITVTVTDLAGNSITEERIVNVNLNAPTITDIKPDSNVTVKAGDEVEVSFHSNAVGGTAYFRVNVPNEIKVNTTSNGILMEEVKPGYYVGTWIAPEGINLKDAIVEVEINDTVGNRATAVAEGKLTIVGQNLPPINGEYVSHDRPVTIKATADGEVDWEVNIIDPNGDIVETLTDTGITYEATWGPEEAKKLNGEYTVEVNQIVEGEIISTEEFTINVYNYPIMINDIEIVEHDSDGYVAIEAAIENLGPNVQSPMLVIQVRDENNRVVNISTAKMEGLLQGYNVKLSTGFRVPVSGTYNVEVFVWTGWYDTEALSSPETATFIIE